MARAAPHQQRQAACRSGGPTQARAARPACKGGKLCLPAPMKPGKLPRLQRGVGVKTGDSPAPWRSDNNCTRPDPDAFADQIMREQWGLSPFSIERLQAGASISSDGFTLCLENGQVQSIRALPSELDWELDRQPPAEQSQLDEYALPEDTPDWPMLIELCCRVYQAQGHAGAHSWTRCCQSPISQRCGGYWKDSKGRSHKIEILQ